MNKKLTINQNFVDFDCIDYNYWVAKLGSDKKGGPLFNVFDRYVNKVCKIPMTKQGKKDTIRRLTEAQRFNKKCENPCIKMVSIRKHGEILSGERARIMIEKGEYCSVQFREYVHIEKSEVSGLKCFDVIISALESVLYSLFIMGVYPIIQNIVQLFNTEESKLLGQYLLNFIRRRVESDLSQHLIEGSLKVTKICKPIIPNCTLGLGVFISRGHSVIKNLVQLGVDLTDVPGGYGNRLRMFASASHKLTLENVEIVINVKLIDPYNLVFEILNHLICESGVLSKCSVRPSHGKFFWYVVDNLLMYVRDDYIVYMEPPPLSCIPALHDVNDIQNLAQFIASFDDFPS